MNIFKLLFNKIDKSKFPLQNGKQLKKTLEFQTDEIIKRKYVFGISPNDLPYVALFIDSYIINKESSVAEASGEVIVPIDLGYKYYEYIEEQIEKPAFIGELSKKRMNEIFGNISQNFVPKVEKKGEKTIYKIISENKSLLYSENANNEALIDFMLSEMYKLYYFSTTIIQQVDTIGTYGEQFLENILHFGLINKIKFAEDKAYKQFPANFSLNLTYPKGHQFEGQPLRKICIIGQSGVGKTNLLNIIKDKIKSRYLEKWNNQLHNEFNCSYGFAGYSFELGEEVDVKGLYYCYLPSKIMKQIAEIGRETYNPRLIYFPAEIINQIQNIDNDIVHNNGYFESASIVDFSIENTTTVWKTVQKEIAKYKETFLKELYKSYKKSVNDNAIEKMKHWEKENPNPLHSLALCLDKFLNKFKLQIKTDLDFNKLEDIKFVKIETEQGIELGNLEQMLSTGTKQVILTAIPLYSLKPQNSIIIFDEPERSLYPDIQKDIIPFYTSFGLDKNGNETNCQFFFATHSPIVASCFEPWEVIELKYKETCKLDSIFFNSSDSDFLLYENFEKYSENIKKKEFWKNEALIEEFGIPQEIRDSLIRIKDIEFANKSDFFATIFEILNEDDFNKYKNRILKESGYGFVYQELWYKGERHINNYTKFPEYLRWDSILMDIYGLEHEGNEKREKELLKFLRLKRQIETTKDEERNSQEYNEKALMYLELANKLGWEYAKN